MLEMVLVLLVGFSSQWLRSPRATAVSTSERLNGFVT